MLGLAGSKITQTTNFLGPGESLGSGFRSGIRENLLVAGVTVNHDSRRRRWERDGGRSRGGEVVSGQLDTGPLGQRAKRARQGRADSKFRRANFAWPSLTDCSIKRRHCKLSWYPQACFEDDDYLMGLALAEITENLRDVAKSVVMLGKKCKDPKYHNLERTFDDEVRLIPNGVIGNISQKKMEKKIKKMERFVGATEQLHQELEVLAELEQSLRQMRASSDVKLLEFQQKVMWQRQEVKNLRETSPWVKTYDYILRLLLKSIFTIIERIKYVCGTKQSGNVVESNVYEQRNSDYVIRSNSLRQTLVYPSETNTFRYAVPLGRSFSSLTKSKNTKSHYRSQSSIFTEKQNPVKDSRLFPILCNSKSPPKMSFFKDSTLGGAGLAVHYANVIILIEKLASSPNLISLDARDDLYSMLPATIRSDLRAKLKTFSRNLALSVYDDAAFAAEWRLAVERILEWLSPLAHNMVRWQSERNFERWRLSIGSNVHLVQTLHFANQVETGGNCRTSGGTKLPL
ncbi:hypothetical protein DH2020_039926 [Rehmannia glutinosa]|uniref:DUF668 domain-containing protein n=1 Tax=Rehmannia glutinosa TaxID=99300 RepID=A0ABR0UUI9_REHGL